MASLDWSTSCVSPSTCERSQDYEKLYFDDHLGARLKQCYLPTYTELTSAFFRWDCGVAVHHLPPICIAAPSDAITTDWASSLSRPSLADVSVRANVQSIEVEPSVNILHFNTESISDPCSKECFEERVSAAAHAPWFGTSTKYPQDDVMINIRSSCIAARLLLIRRKVWI